MKVEQLAVVFLLAVSAAGCQGTATARESDTARTSTSQVERMTAPQLAQLWLRSRCGLGENRKLEAALSKLKTKAEPIFLAAYESGPPADRLKKADAAARVRFAARKVELEKGENLGLSKEDLAAARAETKKNFVGRARTNVVSAHRSQALLGLGIVGGANSKILLKNISEDANSPFRWTAKRALNE